MWIGRQSSNWEHTSWFTHLYDVIASSFDSERKGGVTELDPMRFNPFAEGSSVSETEDRADMNAAALKMQHMIEMTSMLPPEKQEAAIASILKRFSEQ